MKKNMTGAQFLVSKSYTIYVYIFYNIHIFFICIVLFSAVLYTFVLVVACEPVPQQTESTSLTWSSQLSSECANSSSANVQHSEILSTVNRCHLPENTALGNTLTNAELCDDRTVEVIL